MRNKLLAALLAILVPTQAFAGPVVAFAAGLLGVAGGTALATTTAYLTASAFAQSFIGGLIVRTAISVGLAALAKALAPKPRLPTPSDRMVNFAQPQAYMETVYGRTRKGGPIGFTGFVNSRRYYVPILAGHSINSFVEHWLDERVVTLNSETDQNLSNIATAPIAGYGRINTFDGGAGQVVDPGLDAAFTEITSAHDFKGLAGAVVWAKRPPQSIFSEVYPTGRQWMYAPVIEGKNTIYDPRNGGSTGYTNNAALVLADWIVNVLGQQVDWTEVATEADVSDEVVTNKELGTQKRWTINGTISDGDDFEDQRAQMAAACDAFIYERTDGKVGFKVGRWIAPTDTLTEADFFSLELTSGQWGSDAATEVVVTYTEPANSYRETPSGRWVEKTGVKTVTFEPALYMIDSHNQAARVAKRLAKVQNAKYRLRGTVGMIGYELIGKRFIRVKHTEMGIDEYFEVAELTREGPALFSITAVSSQSSDFDFDAATEEPTRPSYGQVTSADGIPDVSGLTATTVTGGGMDVSWTAVDSSYTQQVRIRVQGDTNWYVYNVPEGQNYIRITGLIDGTTYEVQARNRTVALRPGNWKPDTPITNTITGNTTAPASLVAFGATVSSPTVTVTWTTPNDVNYAGIRIYRNVTNDFATATLVTTEYGAANTSGSYAENLADGTYYYWGEPINSSGVAGTKSGPVTVTVASGP